MSNSTAALLQGIASYPASLKYPGIFPPEWLEQSQAIRLTRVAIGFGVVETLFVALFFYSTFKIGAANSMHTYLMVPSYIATFSHVILCFVFVNEAGLGRHWPRLTLSQQTLALKLMITLSLLNSAAITLPKLAILSLYLRVFSRRAFRYAVYTIAIVLIIAWILFAGLQLGMCTPFAYQWDKTITGGRCLHEFQIFTWFGVPSIITDLAIIAVPLPVIWALQTSRNQKIGLTVTFLTGSIGIFTAIIRFAVFLRLFSSKNKPENDMSWLGIDIVIWTTIEPGLYLIAACLPSLRPLLNPLVKDFDVEAVRTRFRIREQKDTPEDTDDNGRTIQLSGITTGGSSSITRGPKSSEPGFVRLDEPAWPERSFAGSSKNSGLATCYRERDSEDSVAPAPTSQTDLQRGQYSYGIVVQKGFAISREPVT